MGSFTITGVRMEMDGFAAFNIPLMSGILNYLGILAIFFGAFWLNLQILFPSPRTFAQKYPVATYVVIYAPLILMLIAANFLEIRSLGYIILTLIGLQIGLGFYFLGRNYARTREPLEKRQIRLVLWGTGAGMTGLLVLPILAFLAGDWVRQQPQIVIIGILIAIFLVLLLSPLSFAYAFGKYRLLEVEGRIRRGTRHLLVTLFLLTTFYVFVFFFSEIFLEFAGIESRTPVLFVALALAVGFAPTQKKLSSLLEDRIFPARVRLREMLNDYLRRSLSTTDKEAFWRELENRFRMALKVDAVTPVVCRNGQCEELLSGGIILGALLDMAYEEEVISLNDGDIIFIYTDRLSESTSPQDEMFGEERIKNFLCANIEQTPDNLLQLLEDEVARFGDNLPLADDFTLLAAKVK